MINSCKFTFKETSPAGASTTVAGTKVIRGLDRYSYFLVDAKLTGGTGGTLDVYLQRKVVEEDGTVHWIDWLHFPQLTAGAAAAWYSVAPTASAGPVAVGEDTSPVLAASTCVGGHPGNELRVLFKTGASNTAGASQIINVTAVSPLLV